MEKNYKEDLSRDDTIRLTIKSLLEVVQTGAKNIEITVMESYGKKTVSLDSCVTSRSDDSDTIHALPQELKNEEIEEIVKSIETEKEAEAERKRTRTAAVAQSVAGLGRDPTLVQTGGAGGVDSGAGSTESGHQ